MRRLSLHRWVDLSAAVRSRLLTALIALLLAAAYMLGAFAPADRFISDLNFMARSRPATDDLILVTIDPQSIQKLQKWPWSRAHHAALIDNLVAAGANTIAFDVDFSAAAALAPEADAALAHAIDDAKSAGTRVILGGLMQFIERGGQSATIQQPLPVFRHSAEVGLVNVVPDPDGRVRNYPQFAHLPVDLPANMANLMSGIDRTAGGDFAIDYSIRPDSIRHLSYVDVLTGKFDAAQVRGRKVLIGGTSLELGDSYAVPRYDLLYGVEIQALAYESLKQDRALANMPPKAVLFGLLYVLCFCRWLMTGNWIRQFALAFAFTGAVLAFGFVLEDRAAIIVDVAPWLAAIGVSLMVALAGDASRHARDAIHHRDAARRHRALMQGVFADSSDGILILDSTGAVELANADAARLLERSAEEMRGQAIESLLPDADFFRLHEKRKARNHHRSSGEITFIAPSGREVTLALTITLSRRQLESRGRVIDKLPPIEVYVVTFRDESARRAVERARDQLLRELQATTAAKSAFLSRMSHELRTPLSAIIGFSDIIRDQAMGPVGNPKYLSYAADIHDGGQRLLNLVNDVIDVARIEANEFKLQTDVVDLQRLLANCAEAALAVDENSERSAEVYVEPAVAALHADPKVIKRAVTNLLSNAVKFTAVSGNIVLRAGLNAEGWIAIAVEDDGVGMNEAALQTVRAAFQQVNGGLNRSHEGAGLGLYIAGRLIELHGGRMEISSAAKVGTVVTLLLPGNLAFSQSIVAAE